MTSLLFNTPAKGAHAPLARIFRRTVHNPGFEKYTRRAGGEKLPTGGLFEQHPSTPEAGSYKAAPITSSITTLPNGVRVASLTTNSPLASVGVYVTSGSRHESREDSGSTHFLKQLAFKSTNTRLAISVVRDIETLGATFSATAGREHLLFESQVSQDKASTLLPILGDMLQPRLAYHEVERQKPHIEEDIEHLNDDRVTSILELVHKEAFRSRGLGKPLAASHHNVGHISSQSLARFVSARFTPENTVVVASGIPHDELVESVKASFCTRPLQYKTSLHDKPSEHPSSATVASNKSEASKYVGGEALLADGGDTYVALAFEGVAAKDQKDAAALHVLKHLLGGGAKQSKEGPGIGLLSRLNSKIVSPHAHVENALAFNLPYSDTGLFGVYMHLTGNVGQTVNALVSELSSAAGVSDATEITRAKQLAKSELLHANSTDKLRFIGSQAVLGSSKIMTPEEYAAIIESVTVADVTRVAGRVFKSRPTLVAMGDVSDIPQADAISATLSKK